MRRQILTEGRAFLGKYRPWIFWGEKLRSINIHLVKVSEFAFLKARLSLTEHFVFGDSLFKKIIGKTSWSIFDYCLYVGHFEIAGYLI